MFSADRLKLGLGVGGCFGRTVHSSDLESHFQVLSRDGAQQGFYAVANSLANNRMGIQTVAHWAVPIGAAAPRPLQV